MRVSHRYLKRHEKKAHLDGLTVDLIRPPSKVLDGLDRESDIGALGPPKGLAIVESFDGSELIEILLHQLGELPQELRALGPGCIETPDGIERLLGSFHCEIDILLNGLSDFANHFTRGWVDDAEKGGKTIDKISIPSYVLDSGLVRSLNELAVDEDASVEGGLALVGRGVPLV